MALHEQSLGKSDEWYTPRYIFDAMGVRFDMDVASPGRGLTPWLPADRFITHDSLTQRWAGFVWMNAPFGRRNGLEPWLNKFFDHGNGVALTPDRTSAPWWHQAAHRADAVLFVGKPRPERGASNKIRFIPGIGASESAPAQGTTLFAAGPHGIEALRNAARVNLGHMMVTPQPALPSEHQQRS